MGDDRSDDGGAGLGHMGMQPPRIPSIAMPGNKSGKVQSPYIADAIAGPDSSYGNSA